MGNVVTASTSVYIATEDYKDTVKYPNAFGVAPCFDAGKVYRINGGDAKARQRAIGCVHQVAQVTISWVKQQSPIFSVRMRP